MGCDGCAASHPDAVSCSALVAAAITSRALMMINALLVMVSLRLPGGRLRSPLQTLVAEGALHMCVLSDEAISVTCVVYEFHQGSHCRIDHRML